MPLWFLQTRIWRVLLFYDINEKRVDRTTCYPRPCAGCLCLSVDARTQLCPVCTDLVDLSWVKRLTGNLLARPRSEREFSNFHSDSFGINPVLSIFAKFHFSASVTADLDSRIFVRRQNSGITKGQPLTVARLTRSFSVWKLVQRFQVITTFLTKKTSISTKIWLHKQHSQVPEIVLVVAD